MRILYGVTGDGLGHTMRARTIGAHLERRGHTLAFAASGRTVDILRRHFDDVVAIDGMHMTYRDGEVKRARTVAGFFARAPHAIARNTQVALSHVTDFDPDVIVTDFDTFSTACGKWLNRPVVSIDHQHVLDRFEHPRDVLDRVSYDFPVAKKIVTVKTPSCAHYIVSSFYFPLVRGKYSDATTLVGPVVRPEIAAATSTRGEHVLVYQTAAGDPRLLPSLAANARTKFIVYGARVETAHASNVELRAFDEAQFVRDLASARAVIANGGFSTLSEAIYLHKPVLSIPIARQPEQELNAAYLDALGLGTYARRVDGVTIARFLKRNFNCASDTRLRSGNADVYAAIDHALIRATSTTKIARAA